MDSEEKVAVTNGGDATSSLQASVWAETRHFAGVGFELEGKATVDDRHGCHPDGDDFALEDVCASWLRLRQKVDCTRHFRRRH